ncbi:class I SAM-dependent methyltransferase [Lentibacillus sediminis]|uniref:class I SAM-dependent methyltransferase n=1 Tax=Lentibacillus sediminis TaxID=1940529 RepID=UPI000C1BB476|nr:class I SAM-dependent methyltransferase [Lentibacillus sediminis]
MLKTVLSYAHELIEKTVAPGETLIDATCGNGQDTLFLSKLTGETGQVWAFDIQEKAIERARELMTANDVHHVSFVHDSHANLAAYLPHDEQIGGAVFNLGYLPRSDKSVVTKGDSTVAAIRNMLPLLKPKGLIVLVVYHGHPGGKQEKQAVLDYLNSLDQQKFHVLSYGFINQKNDPPFLLAIEKR